MKRLALLAVAALALAPAGASAFKLRIFHIPGKNIGCALIAGKGSGAPNARCDIRRHTWKAPPKPSWCELDWGSGMTLGPRKPAQFVCAGDTVLNQGRVLKTGRYAKLGPFSCKSLPEAVRCLNRESGHGFKLSRTVAKRFRTP